MNVYSLRAMTLDNKPIEFTVLDVPVIVGEDRCVLLNRKFSPILKYSTIVIGFRHWSLCRRCLKGYGR